MYVIVSFTLVPVNSGLSISTYIAACSDLLFESGLTYTMHANGTNIEGHWDDVFKVIKSCQVKVHDMGAERIFTNIQLGTRTDKAQNMSDKVRSVLEKQKFKQNEL